MPHAANPPETASDSPKVEEKGAESAPVSEEAPREGGDENAQPV